MNTLLKLWVSLSLSGSVLILALQLLRPLVRRLSKRWQYYIWLVVLARLLLPFTPDTSLMGTLFRDVPPVQTVLDIPSGGGTAGTAPPVSACPGGHGSCAAAARGHTGTRSPDRPPASGKPLAPLAGHSAGPVYPENHRLPKLCRIRPGRVRGG